MTCPEKERLKDYLLGTLDPGGSDAIDEHLDHCTVCWSAVETLETTINAVFSGLGPAALHRGPIRAEVEEPEFRELVEKVKARGGQPRSEARPLAVGTTLGSYVVGAPIGAGGMG